jgi:uncharacterized cupin superfamily protein
MPRIEIQKIPAQQIASYPSEFAAVISGREKQRIGAAGFKAGSGIAHCLINRTQRDAVYLEVGTRAKSERVHYPDVDFMMERDTTSRRFFRKSGEPIPG